MRIAVVGAGGVGGYFGGRLAQAGVDVTFIARGATLDALRTRGLRVDSINGDFQVQVKATDDPSSIDPVDAVFMATKTWQLQDAARHILPALKPDSVVVPLQNGIDAPDQLAAIVGPKRVLGGLCGIVSFIVEPGHIRHAGIEPFLMVGELDNTATSRVARLLETCEVPGIKIEVSDNILRSMWTKFLFIAPLSAIGAATRMPIGVWRELRETRTVAERMLGEIEALARARGVKLGEGAVSATLKRYDGMPADATSSMQRDMEAGRPSELESQLGVIVRLGREHAVPCPVSHVLHAILLPQERRARGL